MVLQYMLPAVVNSNEIHISRIRGNHNMDRTPESNTLSVCGTGCHIYDKQISPK